MKERKRKSWLLIAGILLLGIIVFITGQMKGNGNRKVIIEGFHNELFGENVYIFSPDDSADEVNAVLKAIYEQQETNQFGKERYAIYFLPGEYDESIEVNVGFYMQVAGLGKLPTDTKIASLNCTATWLGDDGNHNACCNFWRGVENIEIASNTMWAVSQATFMRRVQVDGALYLHDNYGWCSGGFLADSNTELMTDSGSQQQWISRNCNWKAWMGENWNMVFVGTEEGKSPTGTWPAKPYTVIEETEQIQEKPFLFFDEENGYQVYIPEVRKNAKGVSWQQADESNATILPIMDFYVAKPEDDTAETINEALQQGKHLILTPGIYELEKPIIVENADTIILGMGLATLKSKNGNACIETADENGMILAGILFDAGDTKAENLLVVGHENSNEDNAVETERDFIQLSDLFFRVGGTATELPATTECCITINRSNVIGDNFWVWRADHGDEVAWDKNIAENGIVVNGDNVTIYGLMVEHFEKYQTIWNGNNGCVYMYQSEIPYDVPSQEVWMSHEGTQNGYASFYVDDAVDMFEAWGLGIYLYNRDTPVELYTAMEIPEKEDVNVHHICTVMLTGHPGMSHIINDKGDAVLYAGARAIMIDYQKNK